MTEREKLEPFAWVMLSDSTGNTRMWTRNGDIAKAFAAKHKLECIELYRSPPRPDGDAREALSSAEYQQQRGAAWDIGADTKLLPCPFCGADIKHVPTWARSFDPPRLYHEWHHPENKCRIKGIVETADHQKANQIEAARRWNTRAAPPAPADRAEIIEESAEDIRNLGWSVAVHNDYQLSNLRHTFWLFTKDGRAIKGEGRTDADALNQVRSSIRALAIPPQEGK